MNIYNMIPLIFKPTREDTRANMLIMNPTFLFDLGILNEPGIRIKALHLKTKRTDIVPTFLLLP